MKRVQNKTVRRAFDPVLNQSKLLRRFIVDAHVTSKEIKGMEKQREDFSAVTKLKS